MECIDPERGGRPYPWTRTTAILSRTSALAVAGAIPWCLEDPSAMMHFSCDICSKDLTLGEGDRFVIKMEAFAATDSAQLTETDLDADHVEQMAELLNEMEESGLDDAPNELPANKKMRFDLCALCYRKFLADPLGRESVAKFDFSEN